MVLGWSARDVRGVSLADFTAAVNQWLRLHEAGSDDLSADDVRALAAMLDEGPEA